MIKLVYCFRKKWGLTDEEFDRYWHDIHAPIGARIPGMRRLVQSPVLGSPYPAEYDGMAELWFDDLDALARARASREWALSTADEANFIDPDHVASFITIEREIPLILDAERTRTTATARFAGGV